MNLKTSTKRRMLILAVVVVMLTTSASTILTQSRQLVREEFHQTYPLAEGGRVSLENINGAVRISAWDRNEVKVDAVKSAYEASRVKEAEIVVNATSDAVRIKTKYPTSTNNWTNDEPKRYFNPASVEYTLTVPRNARIDSVEIINGSLDIEALSGEVKASSINGRLTARGLTGETKLSVINGRLEATFDRLDESKPVTLGAVNGSLVLVIPSDSNAEVKASTVHGGISNDFGLPVRRGEYVGRDLAGIIGRGGVRIKLQNVNGSITIRHASDGRPLSAATSLLSEARKAEDSDDVDEPDDLAREALREVTQAQREAERERREAQREVERERREALREAAQAQREAEQERLEAEREAGQERGAAQREAEQARREAEQERREEEQTAREAQREAGQAKREVEQAQREAGREAQQARREAEREARVIQREAQQLAEEARRGALGDAAGEEMGERYAGRPRIVARESKTFAASGAPRVRVDTFDGPITVHAWDKSEVTINATKRAFNEREMSGIKLRSEQRGEEINVGAEFDKAFATPVVIRDGNVSVSNSGASVEYELFVPRGTTLHVKSADGRLRIDGVRGEVDLHTDDGSIDVSGGGGRLRADTDDGRIRIVNFDGAVDARTDDGRITLDGRFSQLAARTGDGSISLALPNNTDAIIETNAESVINDGLAVAVDSGNASRRVKRWKIGQGGKVFTLETGEGQVILSAR